MFPLSNVEKKYLRQIEQAFENEKTANFTDKEFQLMQDSLYLLCEREVICDINADGVNMYTRIGSFEAFDNWMSDQEKKAKKISRREWKIAIISAVIGAVIGLIPTLLTVIGGM